MISVYDLKPRFQALLRPLVDRLAARGVTPNQLTLATLGVATLMGALLTLAPTARALLLLLPLLLLLRMAANALDGMLAREHGLQSPRGVLLNEVGDVLGDALLYLPLALHPGVAGWLLVAVLVLGLGAEVAGLAAVQIGASRRQDGPLGKSDRALLFGLIALILGLDPTAGAWLPWLLWPALGLAGLTIQQRIAAALAEVNPGA